MSAKTGEGLDELTNLVIDRLDALSQIVDVFTGPGDGRTIAVARSFGVPLEEDVAEDGSMRLRLRLSAGAYGVLQREVAGTARIERV